MLTVSDNSLINKFETRLLERINTERDTILDDLADKLLFAAFNSGTSIKNLDSEVFDIYYDVHQDEFLVFVKQFIAENKERFEKYGSLMHLGQVYKSRNYGTSYYPVQNNFKEVKMSIIDKFNELALLTEDNVLLKIESLNRMYLSDNMLNRIDISEVNKLNAPTEFLIFDKKLAGEYGNLNKYLVDGSYEALSPMINTVFNIKSLYIDVKTLNRFLFGIPTDTDRRMLSKLSKINIESIFYLKSDEPGFLELKKELLNKKQLLEKHLPNDPLLVPISSLCSLLDNIKPSIQNVYFNNNYWMFHS